MTVITREQYKGILDGRIKEIRPKTEEGIKKFLSEMELRGNAKNETVSNLLATLREYNKLIGMRDELFSLPEDTVYFNNGNGKLGFRSVVVNGHD